QFPGNTEKPRLRPWRCELTACSRYTNFYFVAHGKVISVYEPLFGDQALGSPVIVLHPPVSVPAPQGYIDPRNPHDIDRLHVDYLGRKEVLLVACDDGDVVGYYVSAIKNAVEGRTPGAPVQEPRPFLHTNVRLSAWGLSVHRRARLLAISSNTGIITVIAFALASNNGDGGRAHSVKEFNVGHNIPFISFNNSGTDPEGRWLLSASISGDAQLWDLHRSGEQGPAMPYCPYIIVCKNEVYLFQPGNPASPSTYSLANLRPIIAAPEPLKPPDTLSSHWDRMNYSLYIAELGIFLVAAPSGRCAIFTLTQYNIPVKDSPNQTKTIYGMRQDYTLPFKEQEEQDPRFKDCWRNGRVLLVGIAAGPAQGCMDKEEDERGSGSESESEEEWHGPRLWRLFLHYSDHTVLTYELVRKARGLEQDWGVLPAW
ncbi:uncharacterized protein EI97DRAFT_478352, partial [Westerdykella ornata]